MSTRIAFCITDLDPGGAERALAQIVKRLDGNEWEPAVYCLGPRGSIADVLEEAGVPVICLGARSRFGAKQFPKLVLELRRFQPALLQTMLFHANIAGRFAAKGAGIRRVICGIRVAERGHPRQLWMDRVTQSLVAQNVCVSVSVANFAVHEGGLSPEKVTVIPNGVDSESLAAAKPVDLTSLGIPADSQTLLFVGRLHPQKQPIVLLKAFEGLSRAYRNLHLLMVGDGPLARPLIQWTHAQNLADRVRFLGRCEDVPQLMKACTCLVLPSAWEGLPNVVLEAMACGLPVIATNVDGTSDVIETERTGLLVGSGSVQELASAVALLLSDSTQATNMAAAAQEHVSKTFTWDRCASQHVELYREALTS